MPKFKVTATMDVGYTAIIEAENEEKAWAIARNGDEADWEQTDNGHDWTLENIREVDENEVSQAANIALDWTSCEQGEMGAGKSDIRLNDYIFDPTVDKIEFPREPLNEKIVENDYIFDPKVGKEALKEVAGFLRNPPRNPFASETQSIKGHKSRK